MSTTHNEQGDAQPPGPARTILFGTALGAISSVAGMTCILAILFAYGYLTRTSDNQFSAEYFVSSLPFVAGYIIIYADYTFIPATIGGSTIGWLLYALARARRLAVWIAVVVGVLVGLGEAGATAWIIAPTPNGSGWIPDSPRGFSENWDMGTIQGLFVSMILYAWFRRRMSKDEELPN